MKDIHEYEKDLSSIRSVMERSVKFISLSGLSGVLAGIYALIGAAVAYYLIHYPVSPFRYRIYPPDASAELWKLTGIAAAVLAGSILTALWFSHRKAKSYNLSLWNATSRRLLTNLSIPLITGGIFILILLYNGHFEIIAPSCLIFYGLALIQCSPQTYEEIRYLGLCEIALGLIAAALPGYGLLLWAFGFGILHVAYGGVMHYRYDQ